MSPNFNSEPDEQDPSDEEAYNSAFEAELDAALGSDEDELDLEDEFPMGDGVADVSTEVHCPYCGEAVEIALDPGSGTHQNYVEDCQVCCQPWRVSVYYTEEGHAEVSVSAEDET
ncbi:MAG: CPXCG motif-containing cysteine-rich protein [Gemmatimonadaceae bacterium]